MKHDFPKKGMITMHFKSINHKKMPLIKGVVRADTLISGYIFEEEPNGKGGFNTKLIFIT